ncbi:alpha/beta-gliadin MM1 [Ceratitis capitata]|uniref:alpha/beta-gliadin MM1 n=1 Tax=Ceratitis capitata TaxID=7213 RepID=UPI00061881F6|nr:alpha/beta-gliadin MM1 [Ceratitis capitata]
MFHKSTILLLVLGLTCAIAEPPRFHPRNSRFQQRRPFFARQESAPAQPEFAPYPSADELKPENPFQAEEEAVTEPELVYGPPDATYGPPLPVTDPLPAVESPPDFAPNPDAEEFARLTLSRPSRLQQRFKHQKNSQFRVVQQSQRLQQRKPQQKAVIKQILNTPQQRAKIQQVVSTQRLVSKPAPAAAVVVAAPAVAATPAITPAKVVISSERLVAVEPAPFFSASIDTPIGESYVVVNSPFSLTSQYQSW